MQIHGKKIGRKNPLKTIIELNIIQYIFFFCFLFFTCHQKTKNIIKKYGLFKLNYTQKYISVSIHICVFVCVYSNNVFTFYIYHT